MKFVIKPSEMYKNRDGVAMATRGIYKIIAFRPVKAGEMYVVNSGCPYVMRADKDFIALIQPRFIVEAITSDGGDWWE